MNSQPDEQWRHFGAKYVDMHTDYTGQGVDQLKQLIHTIRTKPTDRRLILSAWNPAGIRVLFLFLFVLFVDARPQTSPRWRFLRAT